MERHWIEAGWVRAVEPGKRQLRVVPHARDAGRFTAAEWVRVEVAGASPMVCRVAQAHAAGAEARLVLANGVTRDNVARMKGATVSVEEKADSDEPDMAWDVTDLIGLAVRDEAGCGLGTVVDAFETGAHGVLEIENGSSRLLIPAIEQTIASVDFDEQVLIVKDLAPFAVEDTGSDADED